LVIKPGYLYFSMKKDLFVIMNISIFALYFQKTKKNT